MCPGITRPWRADDGLLVRLRLVGGRVSTSALRALLDLSERFGDGRVHLTSRANLQLRGLPEDGTFERAVLPAIEDAGLLPSRTHDLVRNVMVSPQTGLAGGRADLRPVADELDRAVRADRRLATLPAKFLFTLDDRGDLLERTTDLGMVALDAVAGQLRVGDRWGGVATLADAPSALLALAHDFLDARGDGEDAAWHVRELPAPLIGGMPPRADLPPARPPLPYGEVAGGIHLAVPEGSLGRETVEGLLAPEVVITPWRGVLVPEQQP